MGESRMMRWVFGVAFFAAFAAAYAHYFGSSRPLWTKGGLSKKWEFQASGPITGALALGDDGTLYATSTDGFLWALDASGNLKWKFEAAPMKAGPTLGDDGSIYLLTSRQEIFGVDHSGSLMWSNLGDSSVDTKAAGFAQAIDSNDLYALWRGQLRAVRLSTGKVDWSTGVGYTDLATVTMLPGGDIVYPGVKRVDRVDSGGQTLWHYPAIEPVDDSPQKRFRRDPGFLVQSGIAVAADGTLYASVAREHMVAISPDGRLLWEFKTQMGVDNPATPVVAKNGNIYFASQDQNLYEVCSNGNKLWSVYVGGAVTTTPVLADDGTIYVVNSSGLVAVSNKGEVLGRTMVGGALQAAPTLGPDGTVYVGSETGKIFAFAGNHGGLMKSSWPKFQADLANSGRAQQN